MKKIQILGTGCPKCKKLLENVEKAVNDLELECKIEKVSDINEIVNLGVMSVPTLMIDGKIAASGTVPPVSRLKILLTR